MGRPDRLVLIVDDSPEDRSAVRRYLTLDPLSTYRILEEMSGAEGLAICGSAALDCLIVDYQLPDMNGLEFIQKLTSNGTPPFPIVMLTGRGNESIAVQALKYGAQDYLVKGHYSAEVLCATVRDAIDKHAIKPRLERQRVEVEQVHQESQEVLRRQERLVLLLDDTPEDREIARRYLSRDPHCSYRFLEESDGEGGLAICRSAGLDCLLLDYSLPDMNGLEFLNELTSGTSITPFPVVMMTGRGDETIAVKALKRGAQDYLIKGRFNDEGLRRTVDNAITSVVDRRAVERQRLRVLEALEKEARQRAEELAEMDRRKNEFLAMLAHELRNPLAPIRSALYLMEIPGIDSVTVDRARNLAKRQVGQMARLIDDLLEVSRITRGKIDLTLREVELTSIVHKALESTKPLIDEFEHHLELSILAPRIHVEADETRIEQILVNVLNNAAKYTSAGGRISLSLGCEGSEAVIRVRDTGIGIAPEMLPRVFDMFAQVDRSLDRAKGGLGIGLTLVKTLIQMHGGTVEAVSAGLGKGSEFILRLPVIHEPRTTEDQIASAQESPPAALKEGRSLHVLLVEDHVEGAELLASLLRLWGHTVRAVYDGKGAIEAVEREKPDLILLDLGLPHMDGYEVARRIREKIKPDKPYLVALTGYGEVEARVRSQEAGFDLHLVKPVDPEALEALLATFDHSSRAG